MTRHGKQAAITPRPGLPLCTAHKLGSSVCCGEPAIARILDGDASRHLCAAHMEQHALYYAAEPEDSRPPIQILTARSTRKR